MFCIICYVSLKDWCLPNILKAMLLENRLSILRTVYGFDLLQCTIRKICQISTKEHSALLFVSEARYLTCEALMFPKFFLTSNNRNIFLTCNVLGNILLSQLRTTNIALQCKFKKSKLTMLTIGS